MVSIHYFSLAQPVTVAISGSKVIDVGVIDSINITYLVKELKIAVKLSLMFIVSIAPECKRTPHFYLR